MISSRLPADLSVNATTRALDALRRRGIDVIDLTESNPTRVGLDYPRDLLAPLASPAALAYEPSAMGLALAREAVAHDFARRGQQISPDHIGLTASTSEAYALLFKLLCDAGDVVLVPRPSYPLFEHLTVLESVVARAYRLEYHGSWRLDIESVRQAIDDRTRAILVVSPNNPTGSFLHSDDLMAIAELCASQQLVLIGDEVFSDFSLDGAPNAVCVAAHAREVLSCSLGGLSKSVGLPQLKLSWIGFSGPAAPLDEVLRAYEVVADTYLSVGTPVQAALPELFERGAAIREAIHARVRRNLQSLRELAGRWPEISVLRVEGGWSAVIQVPAYRSEESLVLALLTDAHVLVHPGFFFDFDREAFLVLSLLAPPDRFDEGVSRVLAHASRAIAS
jgi:alanine-synthesizing transaminase